MSPCLSLEPFLVIDGSFFYFELKIKKTTLRAVVLFYAR